jgi:hypothetical protein
MKKVKLISFNIFEIGNGFEVESIIDDRAYHSYLQLPDCADSEHSLYIDEYQRELSDIEEDDLKALIEEIESKYSKRDLSVWSQTGRKNCELIDCDIHTEVGVIDLIAIDAYDNSFILLQETFYKNIYEKIEYVNEDVMRKVQEFIKER